MGVIEVAEFRYVYACALEDVTIVVEKRRDVRPLVLSSRPSIKPLNRKPNVRKALSAVCH